MAVLAGSRRLRVSGMSRRLLACLAAILFLQRASAFTGAVAGVNRRLVDVSWDTRRRSALQMVAMRPDVMVGRSAALRPRPGASRPTRSTTGSAPAGLPWRESIAGPEHPLTYMPFLEWALYELGSRFHLEALPVPEQLAYAENLAKPGRIASLAFHSKEIRRLRLTYFDGGPAVQVLNAVLYPDPSMDLPVLGLDLISFGQKHLAGIDFQPLYDDAEYRERYTAPLRPIKERYPELGQRMSQRFYDSARFFSDSMLFARYEDSTIIPSKLFPAFTETVATYASVLEEAARAKERGGASGTAAAAAAAGVKEVDPASVLGRHKAYDQYNAERDPAHGLFVSYFGETWAERFMDEFLFELSEKPAGGYAKGARQACGGAPPAAAAAAAAPGASNGAGSPPPASGQVKQ